MHVRRLIASVAVIGLLLAAAAPVAASGPSHHPKSNRYTVTTLVTGPSPDTDLVNGWGLSRSPTSPWWVADNGTDMSTLYTANGTKLGLRVSIPEGAPTGTVFNPGAGAGDFNGDLFLFDGEAGKIFGWRGALGTTAEVLNDDFAGDAVYKGLAIGSADVGGGSQQYIYATDFHNGRVDVFDRTGAAQTWVGAFTDPKLPKGFAPFGIQNLNGMLFVTYAKTQAGSDDEMAGRGRGLVDAFATNGAFLGRVASHGQLNAPWGLAWAPTDFGRYSGDLLVGNFGDGHINAYRWDGKHWHAHGTLRDSHGQKVAIDGLWAIAFGGGVNLANDGAANTLFFAAGPHDEEGGAFGTVMANQP
jgi:uncharacterized protein (TIGR03118 family)